MPESPDHSENLSSEAEDPAFETVQILPDDSVSVSETVIDELPKFDGQTQIIDPENSGSSGERGGRRITSSSSVSASKTSEHTGSITIS